MKTLDVLATVLVIVGALNWGIVGVANLNLVSAIFGQTILASIVYALVGIAGVYQIWRWSMTQKPAFATA